MGKFIYNVGEITTRSDHFFWIFPSDYINDEEYTICSPWFSVMGEKWRMVKDPHSEENMYYSSSRHVPKFSKLTFRLWKKGGSTRLIQPYTLQLSLTSTKGTKMTEIQNIDSDYGCAVDFRFLKDPIQTFSQNRLVKLLIIIQKMKTFENDSEGPATPVFINDVDYSTEEETNNGDEEFREYDMNSEENDISEKKHSATKCKGVQRLVQNLKRVFLDGDMCDAVLKVNGRQFSVHKLILVARSSVFASMFHDDLAERNTNVVDIPDCAAESFEIFLHYLYTGTADNISANTVCNLYYAADKYQVEDLKEECVQFMENNISEDTFCDIISLSLRHAESKLQNVATEFFCANIKTILKTVQWQKFITENRIQANELLIKAHNS